VPTSSTSNRPARSTRLRRAATGIALGVVAAGAGGAAATLPDGQDTAAGTDTAAAVLSAAQEQRDDRPEELGATQVTHEVTRRVSTASRSASRAATVPVKRDVLTRASRSGRQVAGREDLGSGDPRAVARAMLSDFGLGAGEFSCLDSLWEKESGWDPHAANPTSSAYGIPQALPGSKMASAGADWADNPATQIRWGLGYIQGRYGSPCAAWSHSQANNWY
jgi:hypothetical protein